MGNSFGPEARWMSRLGLGLVLLVLLVLPAVLSERVAAQGFFTPTPTRKIPGHSRPQATLVAPPIMITKSVPTFVVTDVRVLNLRSEQGAGEVTRTTADLNFEDQFTATINVQSPSSMRMGESRVITLEVIPERLAQAAMVRAELHALKFDSLDDGQPEKTVLVNTPVRWNWNIAPKETGEQEFFLTLSYVNINGSRVHWQNITLKVTVSLAATPTGQSTATAIDTPTPKNTATLLPENTPTPTWTSAPTNLPDETPIFTMTATHTLLRKLSDDAYENPAPYLGMAVTLMVGLLSAFVQYLRKGDKKTDNKNRS